MSNVQDKYKNNLDYNLKQKIIEAVIFQSADPINFMALEKYVSDKEVLDDIVLNAEQYPENTLENSKKWIYLSDVLEQYLAQKKG